MFKLLSTTRFRLVALVLLGLAVILPWPTHGSDCSGSLLSPRLMAGGVARAAYLGMGGVLVRSFPGDDARSLGTLPEGTALNVVRGPTCAGGQYWWQVETLTGQRGWTAESHATPGGYALEPWQILVDLMQKDDFGYSMVRANNAGLLTRLTRFEVPRLSETIGELWPPQEVRPLDEALATVLRDCPAQSYLLNPIVAGQTALDPIPVETGRYTAFPSPDAARLLIIRHLWRSVVTCRGEASDTHGIDRVSLIVNGAERVLFDIPASARLPGLPREDMAFNRVDALVWSPDNRHAVATVRYGERTRLVLLDTQDASVASLDEGLYAAWFPDGERMAWLRFDSAVVNLITARKDGDGRQTIALPASLDYTKGCFAPLWNVQVTWLLVPTREAGCRAAVAIDLAKRQAFAPLPIPEGANTPAWILGDSALLWPRMNGDALEFVVQLLTGETRILAVPIEAGETLDALRIFPGGHAALVALRGGKAARYLLLSFEPDGVRPLFF